MVWQPVAPSAAPISMAAISPSGVSLRPLAVFGLVFRSQPHIEHGAENRIAGAAAGGDDDAFARPDIHGPGLRLVPFVDLDGRDAGHPPGERAIPVNLRHLVLEQDLDADLPRGLFQGSHE